MALDLEERKAVAQAIRAYIARERISRETFARRAKIGKSTVDKLVTGIASEKTIIQIEEQLKLKLRAMQPAGGMTAAPQFGGYAYEDAQKYFGTYILIRPAFTSERLIYAFAMDIHWADDVAALAVTQKTGGDKPKAQFGHIHMPRGSMHVFIVSNDKGWANQAILSALGPSQSMKGVLLTMGNVFGNVFSPVSVPIVLMKVAAADDGNCGAIKPEHPDFQRFADALASVEKDNYGTWITLPPA